MSVCQRGEMTREGHQLVYRDEMTKQKIKQNASPLTLSCFLSSLRVQHMTTAMFNINIIHVG
jgi:hypothetical protein